MTSAEHVLRFECFGTRAAVCVGGADPTKGVGAEIAAAQARAFLREVHARLSRFLPDSELSAVNADRRESVPASWLFRRFASAVVEAGELTDGLVDATRLDDLERAGYRFSRDEGSPALAPALWLRRVGGRRPAAPHPDAMWREVCVDDRTGTVSRPPGLRLDSGGIAKGLAADLVAGELRGHATFAVDCGGDIRIGGAAGLPRPIAVEDPFSGETLEMIEVTDGAVATSGIGRRSWLDERKRPAHHLIDPASGRPAFTGVVQCTALAPTALEAEALAKAALLSGPERASVLLVHGGLLVLDDTSWERVSMSEPGRGPA